MTISTRCRALAEQAKVMAKSLHCRANADARAAAYKAASVYVMAAGWSETMEPAALAERCREQGNAYLASAKPYKAGPKRSAYVRGAAALFEVARWAEEEDVTVHVGCGNVFEDLGLPDADRLPAEADARIAEDLDRAHAIASAAELPTPRRRYTRRTPPAQDAAEE